MKLICHPIIQPWLIFTAGLLLFAALVHGSRLLKQKHIQKRWIFALAIFRVSIILLFLLILARPELTYSRQIRQPPDMIVLLDTSKSMNQPLRPGGPSRLDYFRETLLHGRFAEEWLSKFQLNIFAFDSAARPIAADDLKFITAMGDNTLFSESLAAAWNFYRQNRTIPRAAGAEANRILLFSDGLDRGAHDANETARRMGPAIDVCAMPAAEQPERASVAIVGVQTPGRVSLGSESRFLIAIRRSRTGNLPLTLSIKEDDRSILEQPLRLPPEQLEIRTSVAFRPTTPGLKSYTLSLTPQTPAQGLKIGAPQTISLRVDSRKAEALLLEDTWRWDFPFLRRVFESDPSFAMTAFLARGRGIYMQFGEPDRRVALAGFPQSRPELSGFDLFVLGDVNPAAWSATMAASLRDMVVEDGKSMVIIAGRQISRLAAIPAIASLLPVEFSPAGVSPIEGPIAIELSPEASESPIFFTPPDSAGRWKNLPQIDRLYPPIRKKPAATVLIETSDRANDYGRLIVAAEHTVGRGKVLIICTDTFWKWQLAAAADVEGNTPYSFFWQQALRALQPARLAFGNVQLWIKPNRTQTKTGQPISIEVEIEADRPVTRPLLEANAILPDGREIPMVFVASASDPTRFLAEFEPFLPGRHTVNVALVSDGRTLAEQVTAIDAQALPGENEPMPPDVDYLAHLAATTGGRVITPDNPATWPQTEHVQPAIIQEKQTIDLWSNFTLLLILTAMLGLDWFLRLLRGYV